ncbi:hypothetical protein ACFRR6_01730 [Streptomyces sp. NPDC056891]|uniref:hypothetical protein n=1 Tax=Streptomyces sp. NPDC056891 TaxID=3345961 RepID=UPI00369C3FBE
MTSDEAITLCAFWALFLHLLPLLTLCLETAFSANPDFKAVFRGSAPGQLRPRSTFTAMTLAAVAGLLLAAAVLSLVGADSILWTLLFAMLAGVEAAVAYAWHRPHSSPDAPDAPSVEAGTDAAEAPTDPQDTPRR